MVPSEMSSPTRDPMPTGPAANSGSKEEGARLRAASVSLLVGITLLAAKFWAHRVTNSTAVLSDALESIVNVVAAGFAIGGVLFAGRPADRSHPYGHGKIEFFTAAFEGGLISFAAVIILIEAVRGFVDGVVVREIDAGIAIILGSGIANAGLGWYLIRAGRRYHSLTLVADGRHVLSDFWTSLGVIVSLLVVRLTGRTWADLAVASVVGIQLGVTGLRLVRQAAGGLLDEEDREVVVKLVGALERTSVSGIIRIHHLRAIRAGRFHHIDAHLVVPEFWSVTKAHDASDEFSRSVILAFGGEGEIIFHTDPCRRIYCALCDLPECPIRREPFVFRPALTVDEAVQEDKDELTWSLQAGLD
jgi:cation diffusion facilitator family transporter